MDDLREQVVNGFTNFIAERQKEIMLDCYGVEEATVPLDKVMQARDECGAYWENAKDEKQKLAFHVCLKLFDNLIKEGGCND